MGTGGITVEDTAYQAKVFAYLTENDGKTLLNGCIPVKAIDEAVATIRECREKIGETEYYRSAIQGDPVCEEGGTRIKLHDPIMVTAKHLEIVADFLTGIKKDIEDAA